MADLDDDDDDDDNDDETDGDAESDDNDGDDATSYCIYIMMLSCCSGGQVERYRDRVQTIVSYCED